MFYRVFLEILSNFFFYFRNFPINSQKYTKYFSKFFAIILEIFRNIYRNNLNNFPNFPIFWICSIICTGLYKCRMWQTQTFLFVPLIAAAPGGISLSRWGGWSRSLIALHPRDSHRPVCLSGGQIWEIQQSPWPGATAIRDLIKITKKKVNIFHTENE